MTFKKRNIVIIPVRGGSKRLPGKNILPFAGEPLLVHSITYAQQHLDIVDKIVISTDDAAIKSLALSNNIEVIDRPEELAGDFATTVSALKHVVENLKEAYDNVILLQATNPLRPKDLLKEAYMKFEEGNYDSLMTVSRNEDKLGKIVNDTFVPFNYKIGQRSQDLDPLYSENGLLYITKTSLILEGEILGNKNLPYVVNHPYAKVDIDTKEDFKYAAFILENYTDE
ncbi:MAG: acylneuraminate cytidylyltransferase [Kordia sp.]|nr:MAG: acylneuraminate cytidylyltransferase [Kordia sp.]